MSCVGQMPVSNGHPDGTETGIPWQDFHCIISGVKKAVSIEITL